jgi:transposase InsO family protein
MAARLYYTLGVPTEFSTENKLTTAVGDRAGVRKWLEGQDTYTLHRQVRKKFPRNPYTVNNLMDVWECHLIVVPKLARYNDCYRYILSAIDVFSKYLHVVPLKSKTGRAVAEAFGSILTRYSKRRTLTLQTDKGNEFLNKPFRDMLRREKSNTGHIKTPMLNVQLSKGRIEISAINSTSTLVTKIPTDT